MANIIDSLKEFITPELISKATSTYGESSSAVTKGIDSLIPTILGGLTEKSNDAGAFGDIFDMIKGGASKNTSLLDNLGSLIGGGNLAQNDPKDLSGSLMSSIFGNKVGGILDLVSSVAGLKRSTSSGLMGLVGPLVMSYLGRVIKNKALDAIGLGKFLRNDSSAISRALPAGMGDLLGLGFAKNAGDKIDRVTSSARNTVRETTSTAANTVKSTASTAANTVEKTGGGMMRWLLPLLLLLGLGWFFGMRSCGDVGNAVDNAAGAVAETTKDAAGAVADGAKDVAGGAADMAKDAAGAVGDAAKGAVDAAGNAISALGDFFERALPGGIKLNIPKFGIENKLLDFIEGAGAINKDTWYDFDRITFNTGSASIDMDKSGEQIANIANILKAYPNVKVKIGGYTDNTGSAEGNLKLSQARADAVKAALVAKVIDATRIETEGYGAAHPVASNDTEEGRAKNRRIAVNIQAK